MDRDNFEVVINMEDISDLPKEPECGMRMSVIALGSARACR